MLDFLFGWRKASKCKDMLRCLRHRLKPLRSKNDSIVRQQRQVIAHLLKSRSPIANTLSRVEQLNQDQSMLAAYDILDQLCGFIIMSLCYIRKHKHILFLHNETAETSLFDSSSSRDCPREIIEAIATVMFTAARLANLPELQVLRKLFGGRYGRDFEASAVELYPGNHVNRQMIEKLSVPFISNYEKFNLMQDICREFHLPQVYDTFIINGHRRWDDEVSDIDIQVGYNDGCTDQVQGPLTVLAQESDRGQMRYTNTAIWDQERGQMRYTNTAMWDQNRHFSSCYVRQMKNTSKDSRSREYESSDVSRNSASVSMIKRRPRAGKCQTSSQNKEDIDKNWITIEVSSTQRNEEYNKLIRSGRSRSSNGCSSKRRKRSELNLKEYGINEGSQTTSSSRKRCSRHSSSVSCTKITEPIQDYAAVNCQSNFQCILHQMVNNSREQSLLYEPENLPYDLLCEKRKSYRVGRSSSYSIGSHEKKGSHKCKYNVDSYGDENLSPDCCLYHPCYFLASENEVSDQASSNITEQEMIDVSSIQKSKSNSEGSDESHNSRQPNKASNEVKEVEEKEASEWNGDSQPQKLPPYTRTMSMPNERAHSKMTKQTLRCASLNHVHPMLPDYDDLAAKFTALKREYSKKVTNVADNL